MFPLVAVSLVALMTVMAILGGFRYVAKARRTSVDLTAYQWVTEAAVEMMANLITSGAYLDKVTKAPIADISAIPFKTQYENDCNLARVLLDNPTIDDPRWGIRARLGKTDLKDYSMKLGTSDKPVSCGSDKPIIATRGLVITVLREKLSNESPFLFLMQNITDGAFGGIEFQIERIENDNFPQVPTVRVTAFAFPDGEAKLMSRRNSVFTQTTYAMLQNSVASNALIIPGRLRLDQSTGRSTLGSALAAHSRDNSDSSLYLGDAVIPYVAAGERASHEGIRFMSPVTTGFGVVLPNGLGLDPTTGEIAKVYFNAPLRFTNGVLMKMQEGSLKPYDPARTGSTLASSMADLGRHVTLLEKIVDYRREDLSLSKVFGIKNPGVTNPVSPICREDQKWIDPEISRLSTLVFKYHAQREIASTEPESTAVFPFHAQAEGGPQPFYMSWTGYNRFVKQNQSGTITKINLKEASPAQGAFLSYPRAKDGSIDEAKANETWLKKAKTASPYPIAKVSFALQKDGAVITKPEQDDHDWITAYLTTDNTITIEMVGDDCVDVDQKVKDQEAEIKRLEKRESKAPVITGEYTDLWKEVRDNANAYASDLASDPSELKTDENPGIADLRTWAKAYGNKAAISYNVDTVQTVFNIPFVFEQKGRTQTEINDAYENTETSLPRYGCDPTASTGGASCSQFILATDRFVSKIFKEAINNRLAVERAELTKKAEKKKFADNPTRLELSLKPHMIEKDEQPNTVKLETKWRNVESLSECEAKDVTPVFFVQAAERGSNGVFGESPGRIGNKCGPKKDEDCSVLSDTGKFVWKVEASDKDAAGHPLRFTLQNAPLADFSTMSGKSVTDSPPDLTKNYYADLEKCFDDGSTPEVAGDFSDSAKEAWNFSNVETGAPSNDGIIANSNREIIYKGRTVANFVGNAEAFTFPINAKVHRVIIKPDTTFVTGFFVTDELVIEGPRTEKLVIVASIVASSLNIDKTALRFGVEWYSFLDPAAVPLLQKAKVLGRGRVNCNQLRNKAELYDSPAWQGKLRMFGGLTGLKDLDDYPISDPDDISKEMVQYCAGSFLAPRFKQVLSATSLLPVGIPGTTETIFDVTNVHRGWPAVAVPLSNVTNVTMGQ